MVIVVAVMPGADAVRAAFALPVAAALEPGLELELPPLELQAATVSAATATAAIAGTRSRCDLFIECLLSRGIPEDRSSGLAEPRAGWPAPGRPRAWHPARMPRARCWRRRYRRGREAIALRPGF